MVWILKLLTDYSVPAQRWFRWKRWSTWMCCTWALNLVHVKKTSPTFYCEIAIELLRPYYWNMNVRIRHPRNYHGDDLKTSDWNCGRIRIKRVCVREREGEREKNRTKYKSNNSNKLSIIFNASVSLCTEYARLCKTYWNFPIGIRSSSDAISVFVCFMICIYCSIDVCMKFFPI